MSRDAAKPKSTSSDRKPVKIALSGRYIQAAELYRKKRDNEQQSQRGTEAK